MNCNAAGRHRRSLLPALLGGVALVIGLSFAVLLPVDRLFAGGSTLRAAGLFIAAFWLGTAFAPGAGLFPGVVPYRPYLTTTLWSALGMAAYVVTVDAVLFRQILPADYVSAFLHAPILERITAYGARAFYESLIYRLGVGTSLAWCLGRLLRLRGPVPFGVIVLAMLLAQIINIAANVCIPLWPQVTPMLILWMVVRFVIPGTLWGCLYYRNGLVASEYAAALTHVFLQPVIGLALAATI